MPIRFRLTLWYSAIFGVALAVFGILLYVMMAWHLEGMVRDTVVTRSAHLASEFRAANPPEGSRKAIAIPNLDNFQSPDVYLQVIDAGGTVLARSSNLEGRTLRSPALPSKPTEFTGVLDEVDLKMFVVPVKPPGRPEVWLQVAATYRQRDLVLGRLAWILLAGGLGALAIVAVIARLLAGRTLAPVSDMSETARAIALSRGFSRRLDVSNPKDELGQLAQTFNDMLSSLEDAYATQQRFTADASHELRAPLTAIRGNLDLLHRMNDVPENERLQMLDQARMEVARLSRLVNDLLSLARADAGQRIEFDAVELDTLVIEAHRQARMMANGVNVSLDHVEPVVVQGDEDRLKELLLILIDNALRYTSEGGTVSLWLKPDPPWVVVGVEDTGIGIEQEDIPHLFDRFWRAERARSRDSGGTGLGLAIARWIVELHGGEILVDSTPGKGTLFTVNLPVSS